MKSLTICCAPLILLGLIRPTFGSIQQSLHRLNTSCGLPQSPQHIIDAIPEVAALEAAEIANGNDKKRSDKVIKVKTYFHVLAENKTIEGGWAPKHVLRDQLNLVNEAFHPANIQFDLKDTDYTIYHDWDYVSTETGDLTFGPDLATKKRLRKGDYKALNVYFMHQFGVYEGVFSPPGWATLPNKTEKGSDQFWRDGAHVQMSMVTGLDGRNRLGTPPGILNGKAKGTMLVHEIGHWFGLLHTFQWTVPFECSGPGDYVDDTPQELWTFGCETDGVPLEQLDTCPDQPGIDNRGNFMTNTDEWCMDFFTEGQFRRMKSLWKLYRAGNEGDYWHIGS